MLPEAEQTHEIVQVHAANLLLITEFSNSHLLKATTAPGDGGITAVKAFLIGNSTSGLHGIVDSRSYPNLGISRGAQS